ncbi:hypothetical protein [Pantoea ananatis]|uniref:hypothetical protein n=1 Tax=Pantoea ananas TaxID=553 RepID=UPI00188FF6E5|nr:hypothetical protein [Pantoea ananatis]
MSEFLSKIDANPPHWAGELIEAWDDKLLYKYAGFLTRHHWTESGTINVFCIKGTSHPDYQGLSWSEFLHQGKHMASNLALIESNQAYYECYTSYYSEIAAKQPAMCFNSYNGIDWYVGADGNHRAALARFLFDYLGKSYLHGVQLNHYEFNVPLLDVFLALREELSLHTAQGFFMDLSVNRVHRGRESNPGWKTDIYSTSLYFSTGSWSRRYKQNPAVRAVSEAREITAPAEGIELLVALRLWRERRMAKRNGVFSWLSGRRDS